MNNNKEKIKEIIDKNINIKFMSLNLNDLAELYMYYENNNELKEHINFIYKKIDQNILYSNKQHLDKRYGKFFNKIEKHLCKYYDTVLLIDVINMFYNVINKRKYKQLLINLIKQNPDILEIVDELPYKFTKQMNSIIMLRSIMYE